MLLTTATDAGSPPAGLTIPVSLRVNGRPYDLVLDPRTSLLDALREHLHLTGTKKGCNQGACGACTVLVDGERINACLTLAAQYVDRAITTIEGLVLDGQLSALQAAFITHDGFQCGYCTSGQLCSATALLREFAAGQPSAVSPDVAAERFAFTDAEIKGRMSGNLCRCGAYNGIVEAIREAQAQAQAQPQAQPA